MSNGKGKQRYTSKAEAREAPRASKSGSTQSGQDAKKTARPQRAPPSTSPTGSIDALVRVTPKDRVGPALEALGEASAAMADGRYHVAVKEAKKAKNLSPQDATVRETLGLAAYRVGDWDVALAELRAYRRMAGDAQHLPRRDGRSPRPGTGPRRGEGPGRRSTKADVQPKVWKEGKVVYGSYLLDHGQPEEAWDITGPKRVGPTDAHEADLQGLVRGGPSGGDEGRDPTAARRIADAILLNDPILRRARRPRPGDRSLRAETQVSSRKSQAQVWPETSVLRLATHSCHTPLIC